MYAHCSTLCAHTFYDSSLTILYIKKRRNIKITKNRELVEVNLNFSENFSNNIHNEFRKIKYNKIADFT